MEHSLNGNRKIGYKIASWNCNRGLIINNVESESDKLVDVKVFMEKHKPHLMAIIETDLHGPGSRTHRSKYYTTDEIHDKLIDGYRIELPNTWTNHNQARLIVYVNDQLKAKKIDITDDVDDLPTITFEIGMGRERKSIVNFFYREWTNGVSGRNSEQEQEERLARQINLWKSLSAMDRDLAILGDANLCAKSWHNPDFQKKNLGNGVIDFLLEESLVQIVNDYTRTELKRGNIEKGCIDHIYVNCQNKCSEATVVAAVNSDHLATIFTKYSKEIRMKPRATKKRSSKNFNQDSFIREVKYTSFESVLETDTPEEATERFKNIFCNIIENHAPMKIFQNRKNYAPWLSDATKKLRNDRDNLKEESTSSQDPEVLRKYRAARNNIKSKNKLEKKEYYQDRFEKAENENDSKQVWNSALNQLSSLLMGTCALTLRKWPMNSIGFLLKRCEI